MSVLALTLRTGETVAIGDNIRVTFVEIDSRGQVKLVIDAPRSVPILRDNAGRRTPK